MTLADLEPAEADRLVEVAGDEVHFRHRSCARRPTRTRRRRSGARSTRCSPRTRPAHAAPATCGPPPPGSDPIAAAALEAAASEARSRTGFAAAALAMERAARLTAPGDERAARLLGAAQDRLVGGE